MSKFSACTVYSYQNPLNNATANLLYVESGNARQNFKTRVKIICTRPRRQENRHARTAPFMSARGCNVDAVSASRYVPYAAAASRLPPMHCGHPHVSSPAKTNLSQFLSTPKPSLTRLTDDTRRILHAIRFSRTAISHVIIDR